MAPSPPSTARPPPELPSAERTATAADPDILLQRLRSRDGAMDTAAADPRDAASRTSLGPVPAAAPGPSAQASVPLLTPLPTPSTPIATAMAMAMPAPPATAPSSAATAKAATVKPGLLGELEPVSRTSVEGCLASLPLLQPLARQGHAATVALWRGVAAGLALLRRAGTHPAVRLLLTVASLAVGIACLAAASRAPARRCLAVLGIPANTRFLLIVPLLNDGVRLVMNANALFAWRLPHMAYPSRPGWRLMVVAHLHLVDLVLVLMFLWIVSNTDHRWSQLCFTRCGAVRCETYGAPVTPVCAALQSVSWPLSHVLHAVQPLAIAFVVLLVSDTEGPWRLPRRARLPPSGRLASCRHRDAEAIHAAGKGRSSRENGRRHTDQPFD
ncbi:hypothetical protein CXG81DRAFT_19830 [Caulochytrium protostelioides]|uniref:Uncharacterized protein n=1 Tax=Caulochytrium protostelioides TaxID=1555241 RepID=A0A4P9X4Y6_9FUNG|nr:hypothetical protein CXG81DRAFT_19830 [Caulochytrium protostelioides]|eukprot:RKP00168.1 hypothetical protein CXG81DRAFT_19830 [Caulochytrium protostelioides]